MIEGEFAKVQKQINEIQDHLTVAKGDSGSPETRESIEGEAPATEQRRVEMDALASIVAIQAQAINDMIVSLNNLQARLAALEQRSVNGDKKKVILLQ